MAGELHGGEAVKVLAIARNSLRLLFRERSNIFFVFILPIILILVIGLMFGGAFTPRIGVGGQTADKSNLHSENKNKQSMFHKFLVNKIDPAISESPSMSVSEP